MRFTLIGLLRAFAIGVVVVSIGTRAAAQSATQTPTKPPTTRKPAVAPKAAPAPDEGLTNAKVLEMISAKLSEDLILNAIEDAPKKAFDLSPAGLIALKNGGASNEVIRVMQGRPRTPPPPPPPVPPLPPEPTKPSSAATADATKTDAVKSDEKKPTSGGLRGIFQRKPKETDAPAPAGKNSADPKKLDNGVPAVISKDLPVADATAKVKAFLNGKNLDFNVNPDTGRIQTDWFADHRCGPGIQHCENRATIRVASEEGTTVIRVQVMERKREGGVSEKPWHENSESRGKETAQFAAELESFLAAAKTQK